MSISRTLNQICFLLLLMGAEAFAEAKCPKGSLSQTCKNCQKKGQIWNAKKKRCEGTVIPKNAPKIKVPPSTDEIPPNPQDDL